MPSHSWHRALGTGLLLGMAIGSAWLARWASQPLPRVALVSAAALLAIFGILFALPRIGQGVEEGRQRRLDFQFGSAGIPFFALLVVLSLAAFVSGNNLLYLLVSILLGALLVSGFASALNLSGMVLRFRHPDEIFAGEPAPIVLTLANEKAWWPAYSLTVAAGSRALGAPSPAPGSATEATLSPVYFGWVPRRGSARVRAEIAFPRRGRYAAASFTLATRFPFGLVLKRRRFEVSDQADALLVYPSPAPLALRGQLLAWVGANWERHERGAGQELYRVRPHQPGDSARAVHWKATARAGGLRVREFSREGAWRIRLRLDLPTDMPEDRVEAALSLCAGMALAFSDGEYFLAFCTAHPRQGDERPVPNLPLAPAALQRRAILDYLAVADTTRRLAIMAEDEPGVVELDILHALAQVSDP